MTTTIPGVRIVAKLKVKAKAARESLGETVLVSDDHKELRTIREKLGITLGNMCEQMLIPLSTLQSYIYGKTNAVPEEVMARARALLANRREECPDNESK